MAPSDNTRSKDSYQCELRDPPKPKGQPKNLMITFGAVGIGRHTARALPTMYDDQLANAPEVFAFSPMSALGMDEEFVTGGPLSRLTSAEMQSILGVRALDAMQGMKPVIATKYFTSGANEKKKSLDFAVAVLADNHKAGMWNQLVLKSVPQYAMGQWLQRGSKTPGKLPWFVIEPNSRTDSFIALIKPQVQSQLTHKPLSISVERADDHCTNIICALWNVKNCVLIDMVSEGSFDAERFAFPDIKREYLAYNMHWPPQMCSAFTSAMDKGFPVHFVKVRARALRSACAC